MRVWTVARVVRTSMFVATVALPIVAAACAEPLAPTASRTAHDVAPADSTRRSGATLPWYDANGTQKSGATLPWY